MKNYTFYVYEINVPLEQDLPSAALITVSGYTYLLSKDKLSDQLINKYDLIEVPSEMCDFLFMRWKQEHCTDNTGKFVYMEIEVPRKAYDTLSLVTDWYCDFSVEFPNIRRCYVRLTEDTRLQWLINCAMTFDGFENGFNWCDVTMEEYYKAFNLLLI